MAVRSVERPNLCNYFQSIIRSDILCKTLVIRRLQHSAAVGVGFIPILAAAWLLPKFSAEVGRAGINPAPTVDECNTLIINMMLILSLGR